jgi:molybdate transport system regulatory protein
MGRKKSKDSALKKRPVPMPEGTGHARLMAAAVAGRCLDTAQLDRLEQSFGQWAKSAARLDVQMSRQRILLVFLLIPEKLSQEIQEALADTAFRQSLGSLFKVDPGHVRRKFYERALACGFPKELGGPDALRKARAVELLQNNVPLPVVQRILGHSTPNLTAAFVSFSDDDLRQVEKFFLEKEARRRTSARNAFFGKISAIRQGDIQTRVELVTIGGYRVTTVITNDSLARLGLKTGMLITAEVKAPWVVLHTGEEEPQCSAENSFRGTIGRIIKGKITTEYVVQIADGTELCSVVTSDLSRRLDIQVNDPVWAVFTSFAVVLHLD